MDTLTSIEAFRAVVDSGARQLLNVALTVGPKEA